MPSLTFEFEFTVFVPSINVLSYRIHIMKQLLDQLKGHSHRSWMLGVLSTLAFVIAAFRGDSVKERIHSDSSTSPLSAHHSYQFRRGYKRCCVLGVPLRPQPALRDLYSSVAALFTTNRQTWPQHYLSKVSLSSVILIILTSLSNILVHMARLQLEISTWNGYCLMTLSLQQNTIRKWCSLQFFSWSETAAKTLTQSEVAQGQSGAQSSCLLRPPAFWSH